MTNRTQLADAMLALHDEIETEKTRPRPDANYLIRLMATAQQQCLAAHALYLTDPRPEDPRQLSLFPDPPGS